MSTAIAPAIRDLLRFTRTHLRHHEALMRATGGHFNLFQILGIGHYEVKTHSPILAELLNPKGRHGQGSIFLKLFLKRVGISDNEFTAEGTKVTAEYHIGTKTEDTGGRIDIVIQDLAGRRILIENKIYAGDQEKQVARYRNFDKSARLFYLTRFGDMPSNLTEAEAEEIRCEAISYMDHIRDWLMECRKEATCLPVVRETLSQYIALIEQLTNQSTTKQMNENLINEIIGGKETLSAFFELSRIQEDVKTALIGKLDSELDAIAQKYKLERIGSIAGLAGKFGGFGFTSDQMRRHNLSIYFEFGASGYNDFYFGFGKQDKDSPCGIEDAARALFEQSYSLREDNPYWVAWSSYEDLYRWWRDEAFEGMRSGDLAKNIGSKLDNLTAIARRVCEAQSTDTGVTPPQS
jgi:hypothetical protein